MVVLVLKGKAWQVFDTWKFILGKVGGNTRLDQLPARQKITKVTRI
jgi:hypothetical protein